MNDSELKDIAENLIETTELAGNKSMELYKKGLKKIIKPDNSPVTNGDLEVNKILTEKIKELTQAANSGDANAQYSLGKMALENNNPPDHATAVYWFRIAAESDHLEAIEILGAHLFMGLGVPQNAEQAKEWWIKAANKGSSKAQASLGVLFALGNGIEKDFIESYKWFTLAAKNGNEEAKIQRDNSIALQLSADQIREAQDRVNEFLKK